MKRWKPVREVLDFTDEGESIFGRKKPLVDATLERIYAGLIKFVAGGKEAFLVKWNSMSQTGKYHAPSIDEPCPTVATQNRLGIAQVNFLSKHYGGNPAGKCVSVEEPAPTLTTRDRLAFVDMQYGNGTPCGIETPAPTVTTNPKHQLVTCRMKQQGATIAVTTDDSPAMAKIKRFMALYGIIDIKMRMLRIPELKRIMGFPSDYVLVGTQADQKKFIGNAVEVNMARVLCEALCTQLIKNNIAA